VGGVRLAFHNGRPDRLAVHIHDHKGVAGRLPREGGVWIYRGVTGIYRYLQGLVVVFFVPISLPIFSQRILYPPTPPLYWVIWWEDRVPAGEGGMVAEWRGGGIPH